MCYIIIIIIVHTIAAAASGTRHTAAAGCGDNNNYYCSRAYLYIRMYENTMAANEYMKDVSYTTRGRAWHL